MVKNKNVLSAQQIANFYDRFGKRQDQQAFYEDIAINYLLEESSLAEVNKIIEFGCGTGRMAVRILYEQINGEKRHIGVCGKKGSGASPTSTRPAWSVG